MRLDDGRCAAGRAAIRPYGALLFVHAIVGVPMLVHFRALSICALVLACAACSPKRMALDRMAAALSDASVVYETDNDPEFVRLAAPSTLKTVEMLLSQSPRHPRLLLTACSGFTQYS